jgi:hypothetical protein
VDHVLGIVLGFDEEHLGWLVAVDRAATLAIFPAIPYK